MLSLAVLFAAITACKVIHSLPSPSIDIDAILELAKLRDKEKYLDRESKYDLELPNERNNHYGSLKSQEIEEILQKAKQEKAYNEWENEQSDFREAEATLKELNNRFKTEKKVKFGHYLGPNKDFGQNDLHEDETYSHQHSDGYKNSYNEEALEQLLSNKVFEEKNYDRPKLVPNNLVGSYDWTNDKNEDNPNSNEYSKIFIILNPEAVAKSSNKEEMNNLLRKVLSVTTSQSKKRQNKNKDRRYKGFHIKSGLFARRVRRDSRENSMEEEYKPKRSRSERGGGGGNGGRTAIPYIKNRGDIYERDH